MCIVNPETQLELNCARLHYRHEYSCKFLCVLNLGERHCQALVKPLDSFLPGKLQKPIN